MPRDRLYSRLVAWLKILLPLIALGLLSTIFLLSRGSEPTGELPFYRADLRERARDEVVSAPRYSGATTEGHMVSFIADTAKPDKVNEHLADAENIEAQIDLTSGNQIEFEADNGILNSRDELADLTGGVVIESSTGYVVTTEALRTHLAEINAESTGPIQGTGPIGQFSAGQMQLTSDPETGNVHLLFTQGVYLIYDPKD